MSGYSGMHAWLVQRLSGILIAVYLAFFSIQVFISPIETYQHWVMLFSPAWMQVFTSLFFLSLLFHAWIGLRDVVIDYIHSIALKIIILSLIFLMLAGSGLWLLAAILRIN